MATFLGWILALSFGTAFFTTTKADVVDSMPYAETFKLSYCAPLKPEMFDFAFERMAEQLCPKGYNLVDKIVTPRSCYNLWLIRCRSEKD